MFFLDLTILFVFWVAELGYHTNSE